MVKETVTNHRAISRMLGVAVCAGAVFHGRDMSVLDFSYPFTVELRKSIPERLLELARQRPDSRAFGFVDRHQVRLLTWYDIGHDACLVANQLIKEEIKPGTRVGLIASSTPALVRNIFGVLCAGCVPVTLPTVPSVKRNTGDNRHEVMLVNAGAKLLLATPEEEEFARNLSVPYLTIDISTEADVELALADIEATLPQVSMDDLALLQPTSGTTGFPRAVAVSNRQIFTTCAAMATHLGMSVGAPGQGTDGRVQSQDVLVSWLPLYHDMGLIISLFMATLLGIPSYIISPMSFLLRPAIWLQTISRFRGTFSAAPNFGYAHAAGKIRESELDGLDLSSWRYAVAGAEPILTTTCRAFSHRFGALGFAPSAFIPGYGLAENTLAVTMSAVDQEVREDAPDAQPGRAYVDCGKPLPGTELRIVDSAGTPAPEGTVGQIEIRGGSLMAGYVRDGGAPELSVRDGWLATGDLGFVRDGALYVTGRLKELIIRGGRNFHPHELEAAAAQALGPNRREVVAIGVTDPVLGSERLIVLVELGQRTYKSDSDKGDSDKGDSSKGDSDKSDFALIERVKTEVHAQLEVVPDEVVIVPPRTIRRTTSGKLMRMNARQHYLSNVASSELGSRSAVTPDT